MNKSHRVLIYVLTIILVAVVVSFINMRYMRPAIMLNPYVSGDWGKLNLVLEKIDANYVDTIDHKTVSEELIKKALSELDPHSIYLEPKELETANEELNGEFDGIGITFNVPADTAIVINTIPGGPSERAGLMSGDRIIKVDGKNVAGCKIHMDSLMRMMRGPSGSKVLISVMRNGVDDLIDFNITRDKIPINSLDCAFMVNDTTAYVRLSTFARTTYSEFADAADKLLKQGMKRMIFDVRDNLGGYMDQALLLANEFLEKGDLVVYMEGRNRPREDFFADGKGKLKDIRIDVLVNQSSASSSEIFAGAIQDNDRGKIYGRRSFGKGLVQEQIFFTDGSGIRLTVAKFHTPSGRCIQKPYELGHEEEYRFDIYERYNSGEMVVADSIKVCDSLAFKTKGGRTVYGGGGIIPDVFVGIDTTAVNDFYIECTRKGLPVRFSASVNDKYRSRLREITDFDELNAFLDSLNLEKMFRDYAREQGVISTEKEWNDMRRYIMTQVRALTGRYSSLDDEAFYRIFLDIDEIYQKAIADESPIL